MPEITHPELVTALCKSGEAIADDLNANPTAYHHLLNVTSLLITDGKDLDAAKKLAVYNKKDACVIEGVPNQVYPRITPEQAHLLHMAIGIAGEATELLEAVFNHIVTNNPLDVVNVVEELGDGEFYAEGLRQGLDISRELTLDENIAKLSKRYQDMTYSDQSAQVRADKTTVH